MDANFLDPVPIGVLYVGLIILFLVSVELGYKLGDRRQRLTDYNDEGRSAQAGVVLGAMLGLSGFLLGFTFSLAGGQFDSRRELLIQDTNAIGTAFLRADMLPEPYRTDSRRLYADYVDGRATLFDRVRADELEQSTQIQDELWGNATRLAREAANPVVSIYVQALNDMIDVHGERVYVEYFRRTPDLVFFMLAVLSVLTMVLTGYLLGLRQKRWGLPTALMIFTYATVFLIVLDLDRPARGLFYVRPGPMLDLQQVINESVGREIMNQP